MANRSPPMPLAIGATTAIAALAATAASTALPPCARMVAPIWEASGCSVATMPEREMTRDRACVRSWAWAGERRPAAKRGRMARDEKFRPPFDFISPIQREFARGGNQLCSVLFHGSLGRYTSGHQSPDRFGIAHSTIIMGNEYPGSGSGQPYGSSVTLAAGVRVGGARYILKRVLGR